MSSNSQNLQIPDVRPNCIHAGLLLLAYLFIRIYPLTRRTLFFGSIFICLGEVVFGYLSSGGLSPSVRMVLAGVCFVLLLTELFISAPALQSDWLTIRNKAWLILFSNVAAFLTAAYLLLVIELGILFGLFILQVICSPWAVIFSQASTQRVKQRTPDKRYQTKLEIYKAMLNKFLARLEAAPDVYTAASGLELLQKVHQLSSASNQVRPEEIDDITNLVITSELHFESESCDSVIKEMESDATFQTILRRHAARRSEIIAFANASHSFWQRQALAIIHSYRNLIPARRRRACNFIPTCSEFAEQAILMHGARKGVVLAAIRSAACVPNGGRGIDFPPSLSPNKCCRAQ